MTDISGFFTGASMAQAGATTMDTLEGFTVNDEDAQKLLAGIDALDKLFPELTLHDRCDACSQPAVAQVMVNSTLPNLLFCSHHWRQNRTAFLANDAYLVSEPEDLYALPQH